MEEQEITECFELVKGLVLRCGEEVANGIKNVGKVRTKTDFFDVVTEYDEKVESILIDSIKEKYPMHW